MVSLAFRRYKFSASGTTAARVASRYSSTAKGPPGKNSGRNNSNSNHNNNNSAGIPGSSGEDAGRGFFKADNRRIVPPEEKHPSQKDQLHQSSSTTSSGGDDVGGDESSAWFHQQSREPNFQRQTRFAPKSKKRFKIAAPHKKYYGYNRRSSSPILQDLPLVKDSAHFPILIPGQDVVEPSPPESTQITTSSTNASTSATASTAHETEPHHKRRRRRMLPTVDASALLDSTNYCRNSAFTAFARSKKKNNSDDGRMNNIIMKKNNSIEFEGMSSHIGSNRTEVAKRLLRGKKDLLNLLRGDIILQENSRPFCLAGHGVPKQLLQEHINMGDSILHHFSEPAEVSLTNVEPIYPEKMKIREHDGQSRLWFWPGETTTTSYQLLSQDDEEEKEEQQPKSGEREVGDIFRDMSQTWGERLNLYIAVMDRLASKLGLVGPCFGKKARKQWSMKIYRGMAFPVEVISGTDTGGPVPVLEWNPLNRMSSRQPHVSIRLQGTPDLIPGSKRRSLNPVTLVYGARFQEDPRLEPATS